MFLPSLFSCLLLETRVLFYLFSFRSYMFICIIQLKTPHTKHRGCSHFTQSVVRSPLWTAPSSKVHEKAKASQRIVPQGLSLLYKTLWALQYPSSLCSGLHRHLVADICTEQRGQLELQPKFWLCSCQLERERHREIQVCLLQFSCHPKITVDAHISDIMSCRTISGSHTLVIAEM